MRLVASLVAILISMPALAEGPRPMGVVDLLNVTTQREVRLAPDGSRLLLVRSSADWDQDRAITHVWRLEADGSGLVQMTNGEKGESSPRWAPDGSRFAFVATRKGEQAQAWLQRMDGGEALQLTDHATSVSDIAWAPDGKTLYFLADDPETKEQKERAKRTGDVYSFDRNFQQQHLWAADVESRTERRVTQGDFSVLSFEVSRDGSAIVYEASPTPLYDDNDKGEVWIVPATGEGSAVRLTKNDYAESGARISPDGGTVLFLADVDAKGDYYYQGNLFTVPSAGGPVRMLAPDFPYEVLDAEWMPDGKGIVLLANTGVRTNLFRFDLATSGVTQITADDHTVRPWHLASKAALIAAIASTPSSPGDVWLVGLDGSPARRITRFAEEVQAEYRFPRTEVVHWKGRDGVEVEGILTYPLDYVEGTKVPMVVQTHGGPAASSTLRFPSWGTYAPVLAAMGYAVLDPNYRGSTGYGDAFMRDMVGHYFAQADDDVLAGTDAMIARGIADPKRLAAMGWSAGGHMTDWLVVTTHRFAAASSGAGASNWLSMYAQSDVRTYRRPWFEGTPWQKDAPLELFLEQSPVAHVAGATTPTLILVGEKDPRVPMPQSVEMFRALRANGVDTKLLVFPGEPHGLRTLKHQLEKVNAELDWFEHHVRGRDYTPEAPPETAKSTASEGSAPN